MTNDNDSMPKYKNRMSKYNNRMPKSNDRISKFNDSMMNIMTASQSIKVAFWNTMTEYQAILAKNLTDHLLFIDFLQNLKKKKNIYMPQRQIWQNS